jgi:hypothetical protein
MSEYDEVHNAYVKALQKYRSIERDLAIARADLSGAERARKAVWDRLVANATVSAGEVPL